MRIGDYFVSKGLLTAEQVEIAAREQAVSGEKFGEVLIRLNFLKREQVIDALMYLNPSVIVRESPELFILPEDVLRGTESVVLGESADSIYVSSFSENVDRAVQEISKYTPKQIRFVPCPAEVFYEKVQRLSGDRKTSGDVNDLVRSGNYTAVVDRLIEDAIVKNASDIHFEPQERSLLVRYRIDGVLYVFHCLPVTANSYISAVIKNKAGLDVSETRIPQDGSFSVFHSGRVINIRVSTIPVISGEKISLRILDKEKMLMDITELGITKLDDWIEMSRSYAGLVLVCGPTGSGKTTTLYSTVQYLDKLHKLIYTIEDPVEYQLPFINQVQVNRRVGLDFNMYLKHIVRHDPDVIVVGEIRDRETAESALSLADTGHLVYSTLHTNDIPSTVSRLQSLGVSTSFLVSLLRGILVQRLVRKVCFNCYGRGCNLCYGIGYRGRTAISEIVRLNSSRDVYQLMEGKLPYYSFYEDALLKVQQGITTPEEIERVVGIRLDV